MQAEEIEVEDEDVEEEEDDDDDEEEDDEEEGEEEKDAFSNNCDIIQYIKFCKQTKKIILPLEVFDEYIYIKREHILNIFKQKYEIFEEILSRAEVDTSL
jgi:hypothetical protein